MKTLAESVAQALITLQDLKLCDTVDGVMQLFCKLGYAVEPGGRTLPKADFAFSPPDDAAIDRIFLIAQQESQLHVLLIKSQPERDAPLLSARLSSITRHLLNSGGNYLLIFADPYPFARLTLVNPLRRVAADPDSPIQTRKLIIDTSFPTRHDVTVLESCAATGRNAIQVYAAQCHAFDPGNIALRFQSEYLNLRHSVAEKILRANRNVSLFRRKPALLAFTQHLLNRITLLYFIQKKGWLAGDYEFLTTWHERTARAAGRSYYNDFLHKLFFETIYRRRPNDESPWGNIPYLGSGLYVRDYDFPVNLPNALFDPQIENTVLNFLNGWNFTLAENTPGELQAALGPDIVCPVLGHPYIEEERPKSFRQNPPPELVQHTCREALLAYLQDATHLDRSILQAQFEGNPEHTLTVQAAAAVRVALKNVSIFDPAVGTGVFLAQTLNDLVALMRACHTSQGKAPPRKVELAQWKREFVSNCLCGIATNREMVEATQVRMWLAIIADTERDQIEPLPNLEYRFMRGNLLIETLAGRPILAAADEPSKFAKPKAPVQLSLGISGTDQAIASLRQLSARYTQSDFVERAKLRRQIQQQEAEIVLAHLREHEIALEHKMKRLLRTSRLVHWKNMPYEKQNLDLMRNNLLKMRELTEEIRQGAPLPFFLYRLHFAQVFQEKGGFDIVLGHLPEKQEHWTREQKLALQSEYSTVYSHHVDSSIYFYARGLELLRANGVLALTAPDKLLRTRSAKKLCEKLFAEASLQAVIEFAGLPESNGTATTIILRKTRPSRNDALQSYAVTHLTHPDQMQTVEPPESDQFKQAERESSRGMDVPTTNPEVLQGSARIQQSTTMP